jgi:hypothetical protein
MSDSINIEVIEQCENVTIVVSECGGGSSVELLKITGTNTNSYTSSNLIGRTILQISIDSQIIDEDYFAFNIMTGNVLFDSVADTGAKIRIIYK